MILQPFFSSFKVKQIFHFFHFLYKVNQNQQKWALNPLWTLKNSRKTPIAHVCDIKSRTKCRMIISFVSADRYDPKQVFTYLGHVLKWSRKFFHAVSTQTLRFFSLLFDRFLMNSLLKITENRSEQQKITNN